MPEPDSSRVGQCAFLRAAFRAGEWETVERMCMVETIAYHDLFQL